MIRVLQETYLVILFLYVICLPLKSIWYHHLQPFTDFSELIIVGSHPTLSFDFKFLFILTFWQFPYLSSFILSFILLYFFTTCSNWPPVQSQIVLCPYSRLLPSFLFYWVCAGCHKRWKLTVTLLYPENRILQYLLPCFGSQSLTTSLLQSPLQIRVGNILVQFRLKP